MIRLTTSTRKVVAPCTWIILRFPWFLSIHKMTQLFLNPCLVGLSNMPVSLKHVRSILVVILIFAFFDYLILFLYISFSESRDRSAYILTSHGGHLGFYEGGLLKPNPVTWLVTQIFYLFFKFVTEQYFPCQVGSHSCRNSRRNST
jgi:hypothetical protein